MLKQFWTSSEKRLRIGMAYGGVSDLPSHSVGPRGTQEDIYSVTANAGYEGMQGGDPQLCQAYGLELLGSGVVPTPDDAEAFVAHWKKEGAVSATCIAGYGFEDDSQIDALAAKLIDLSKSYEIPIYVETHRASITQDAWRATQLTRRVPQIRFNGDFSHWFTGQEMLYGSFPARLDQLAPVFERIRFLHGRIGDRCRMQVSIDQDLRHESIPYFREFWIRAMQGFLGAKDSGRDLWFCPELLGTEYRYAPVVATSDGLCVESGDRWVEAQFLVRLALQCFEEARCRAAPPTGETA